MTQNQRIPPDRLWLVLFLAFWGILAIHACLYLPFVADDALISLRYADRLIEGKGLTWTEGRPVEGYSNLLWVLLVALLGAAKVDLIAAARILGFVCMGVVILAVLLWYSRERNGETGWPAVCLGLLFFTLATPVAVWTIGGLEQPLLAASLAVAIVCCWRAIEDGDTNARALVGASFALGLICLTRPDGPIFTVAAVAGIMLGRSAARRPVAGAYMVLLPLFPAAFYGGQLAFRLAYYGEWIPNTALVKITPSAHHLQMGMMYGAGGVLALAPFSFLAFGSMLVGLRDKARMERIVLLYTLLGFWLFYFVLVGGDVMPAYRHFVPLIVIGAFALIEGADMLGRWLENRPGSWRVAAGAILALLFVPFMAIQLHAPENRRAVEERWEWEGKVLALVLKEAFSDEQPLLAVTAAGCLPYWSELPCLDMLGLNDYHIARHKPEIIGRGRLGHEMGDGAYVFGRRPDIICFHIGSKYDSFRSGEEMMGMDEFFEQYSPVRVRGTNPHAFTGTLWFLKESEKIGIRRSPDQIRIPGFLLNGNPDTVARLDGGRLVVSVVADEPATMSLEGVAPADWTVAVKSPDADKLTSRLDYRDEDVQIMLNTKSPNPVVVEEVILRKNTAVTDQTGSEKNLPISGEPADQS